MVGSVSDWFGGGEVAHKAPQMPLGEISPAPYMPTGEYQPDPRSIQSALGYYAD